MQRAVPILLIAALACPLFADQGEEFDVARIPPGLKGAADAVVRTHVQQFQVKNDRSATYKVRRAVTIFDKDDRDYGAITVWYGRSIEIEEFEGVVYDSNGEVIKELEETDVKDYAAFDGFSLYTDTRVRVASLYHHRYPYTVEFSYELTYDGFINWPTWYSRWTDDPVQESRFEVSSQGELRYWCSRDSVQPEISADDDVRVYRWEAINLPYVTNEVVGDIEDISTIVRIAPGSFVLEDHKGTMQDWAQFGKWYADLSKGKNNLPEEAVREVRALVQPVDDLTTKVATLYRYMQSRTRYVSVQLGIGGWQPFDAKYVHERRYGDCKALSNYMQALLEAAAIPSFPVLINSGNDRRPFIEEFPSQQFNHVILCVPNGKDSLWLECTSQSMPVGHIGRSNEGRGALLISPEYGGTVVMTPRSSAFQNAQRRTGTVRLLANGDAEAELRTEVSGNQQDRIRGGLETTNVEERRRWILDDLQIPHVNLNSFSVAGLEEKELLLALSVQLNMPRMATFSGSRMFLRPNLTERVTSPPATVKLRLSPVRMSYPYHDSDSIYYRIPAGFVPESLPAPVTLDQFFGSFRAAVHALGDTALVFTRTLTVHQNVIPASEYEAYRSFFASIFRSDRNQAVLVRKPR